MSNHGAVTGVGKEAFQCPASGKYMEKTTTLNSIVNICSNIAAKATRKQKIPHEAF